MDGNDRNPVDCPICDNDINTGDHCLECKPGLSRDNRPSCDC